MSTPDPGGRGGWKGGSSVRGLDLGRFLGKYFAIFFHQNGGK